MSEHESGTHYRVKVGPFKGQVGVLQAYGSETVELVWPATVIDPGGIVVENVVHVWFSREDVEPAEPAP